MKQRKTKHLFGHFYSPYMNEENQTVDEWYNAFLKDEDKFRVINGVKYYKIIFHCRYYPRYIEDFSLYILVDHDEPLQINDILVDERGNEFILRGFMMIRFSQIPEWYPRLAPMHIKGNTYDIGNYLTKKTD